MVHLRRFGYRSGYEFSIYSVLTISRRYRVRLPVQPLFTCLLHIPNIFSQNFRSGKGSAKGKKEKEPEAPPPPPPEPVVVPKEPKVKVVLKGPHCWVDDATVTSESDAGKTQTLDDVTNSGVVVQTDAQGTPSPSKVCVQIQDNVNPGVEQEYEENIEPIVLPKYLCPSSEKKSKEAAIKDWLFSSHFDYARGSIPLI